MDGQEQPGWKDSQTPLLKAALTYPLYLEKASNVPLKDLGWDGVGRDVGRGFERLLGRDGGHHRSTDVTQQERQLSTLRTLRQLGLKFWLHRFLAVSLCASDLTFLGLLFPYLLSGAKKPTAVRIEYIKCFEQCLVQ